MTKAMPFLQKAILLSYDPRRLGCGFFFVLELVGFEQVGRPQTAKNSPADCFLDRGLRIHQLPPKSCGKNVSQLFLLYR